MSDQEKKPAKRGSAVKTEQMQADGQTTQRGVDPASSGKVTDDASPRQMGAVISDWASF